MFVLLKNKDIFVLKKTQTRFNLLAVFGMLEKFFLLCLYNYPKI